MTSVIVFGCGRYYKTKRKELIDRYVIAGFLDNAVKSGEVHKFEDKEVVNPENIDFFPENVPVILMSAAFFDMWEQLIRLGVRSERIKFAVFMQPFYDGIEKVLSEAVECIVVKDSKIVMKDKEKENIFSTSDDLKKYLRRLFVQNYEYINLIAQMPAEPVSKRFGAERGTPVDRIYIERFLQDNRSKIQGVVMEIADAGYTEKFGHDVKQSLVLHVNGWGKNAVKGNLETGEGLTRDSVDCLICTQTLQFLYDIHSAVHNIYTMLKPGGVALITAHCLGQISLYDYSNWGEYWRFTDQSMRKLFAESFDDKNVEVHSWGNMKAAIAYQYGLCAEDLEEEDFEINDEQFPVTITVCAKK